MDDKALTMPKKLHSHAGQNFKNFLYNPNIFKIGIKTFNFALKLTYSFSISRSFALSSMDTALTTTKEHNKYFQNNKGTVVQE